MMLMLPLLWLADVVAMTACWLMLLFFLFWHCCLGCCTVTIYQHYWPTQLWLLLQMHCRFDFNNFCFPLQSSLAALWWWWCCHCCGMLMLLPSLPVDLLHLSFPLLVLLAASLSPFTALLPHAAVTTLHFDCWLIDCCQASVTASGFILFN